MTFLQKIVSNLKRLTRPSPRTVNPAPCQVLKGAQFPIPEHGQGKPIASVSAPSLVSQAKPMSSSEMWTKFRKRATKEIKETSSSQAEANSKTASVPIENGSPVKPAPLLHPADNIDDSGDWTVVSREGKKTSKVPLTSAKKPVSNPSLHFKHYRFLASTKRVHVQPNLRSATVALALPKIPLLVEAKDPSGISSPLSTPTSPVQGSSEAITTSTVKSPDSKPSRPHRRLRRSIRKKAKENNKFGKYVAVVNTL